MSRMRWMGASAYGFPAAQLVPASTAERPARAPSGVYPGRSGASSWPTTAPPFAARYALWSAQPVDCSGASCDAGGDAVGRALGVERLEHLRGGRREGRGGEREGRGGAERRGREAGTRHPRRVPSHRRASMVRIDQQSAATRRIPSVRRGPPAGGYSHSMVPGGLDVRSRATRLTPSTSLMMRLEIRSRRSYGSRAQSAVIASSEVTARITIGYA